MKRRLFLLCLLVPVAGCRNDAPAPRPVQTELGVTNDDLAHARDVQWWIVEVPEVPAGKRLYLPEDQHLEFAVTNTREIHKVDIDDPSLVWCGRKVPD